MDKIKTAVQLSRLSPYHLFHQASTQIMRDLVEQGEFEECLVLVGSSNQYNKDTPYLLKERIKMVKLIYPDQRVVALPDAKKVRQHKNDFDPNKWLDTISNIEEEHDARFTFLVGHEDDAKWVKKRFPYRIILDRRENGLSATLIRNAIRRFILEGEKKEDREIIEKNLDSRIVTLAIEGYKRWLNTQNEL